MSEPRSDEDLFGCISAAALRKMTAIEREINRTGYALNIAQAAAVDYFAAAAEHIDSQFGEGYAKRHPTLVAAFMQTAAAAYQSRVHATSAQAIADAIRGGRVAPKRVERKPSTAT